MTGSCPALTAAHDCRHVQPYYLHDGNWPLTQTPLCDGCLERLRSMGLDFRPERRGTTRLRVRPRFSLRRAA